MTRLETCGLRAALPIPTSPLSVKISTTNQSWNVNVVMEAVWSEVFDGPDSRASRSIGFVQKCDGKVTVLPFQRAMRVRTSVIFKVPPHTGVLTEVRGVQPLEPSQE